MKIKVLKFQSVSLSKLYINFSVSTSDIQKMFTVAIEPVLQSHICSLISFIVVNVFENSWGC